MPEGLRGTEGSRPRVTARWMMACFCSLSSAITFRFARIARSSRPFAQSRNRTIAACSAGGGNGTVDAFNHGVVAKVRVLGHRACSLKLRPCNRRCDVKNWHNATDWRMNRLKRVGWADKAIDLEQYPSHPATPHLVETHAIAAFELAQRPTRDHETACFSVANGSVERTRFCDDDATRVLFPSR